MMQTQEMTKDQAKKSLLDVLDQLQLTKPQRLWLETAVMVLERPGVASLTPHDTMSQ